MVYVWIRTTVDWSDEQAFLAQVPAVFRPRVELWNATFTMPFHLFRHELKQIAALNLSRLESCRVASWQEIPDGALVMPADDDDWFSPDAARMVEAECGTEGFGCYWRSSFLEVPMHFRHRLGMLWRSAFADPPLPYTFTTNNYALRKSAQTLPLLRAHMLGSDWFDRGGRQRVTRIFRRLSLMNRTLASQTSLGYLRPRYRRWQLVAKYRRYLRLYDRPLPGDLEWSAEYVAQMKALMGRLALR